MTDVDVEIVEIDAMRCRFLTQKTQPRTALQKITETLTCMHFLSMNQPHHSMGTLFFHSLGDLWNLFGPRQPRNSSRFRRTKKDRRPPDSLKTRTDWGRIQTMISCWLKHAEGLSPRQISRIYQMWRQTFLFWKLTPNVYISKQGIVELKGWTLSSIVCHYFTPVTSLL